MLLLRNERMRTEAAERLQRHLAVTKAVYAGQLDLRALYATKLTDTLAAAAHSKLYAGSLPVPPHTNGQAPDPKIVLDELFTRLPLLGKRELSEHGNEAFTRKITEFVHYYESSGTTGDPIAAPKALDDLLVNTVNIVNRSSRT